MLATLLLAFFQSPSLAELNALAQARDVEGLMKMAGPELTAADFKFIKTTGAFGVGSKGWSVELLDDAKAGKQYAVFTTLLTTQDYGDQVFAFEGGKLGAKLPEANPGAYRIRHLDMKIDFPNKPKTVRITCTATCDVLAATGPALFRLGSNYRVEKVTSSDSAALPFRQAGGVVLIDPPATSSSAKKVDKFTLVYEGVVDTPGYSGAIVDGEAMLTNDYWWPSTARHPLTTTIEVHAPVSWDVVTTGERIGETTTGALKTTSFMNDVPIVYLSLSAGIFGKAEAKSGKIDYRIWSTKMTAEEMQLQTELFPPVIDFYSKTFSPHPFTQFGAVDTELYGGGALEAYSYATYGHGWLPDDDAHEPCHTWFGGILPNTYLKSMWNESFASWCEGLYPRENSIGDKADKRHAFVGVPGFNPGWNATTQLNSGVEWAGVSSTLGYGRGGDVLQQLEFEMGTDAMTAAVRKWIKDHPKGEPAEWEGFIAACGPEWSWFFDQWHRRPSAPRFALSDVKLSQSKLTGKVAFDGPTYRLKTELAFNTPKGWAFGSVILDESGVFSTTAPADAMEVIFDPFGRLPMQRKRAEQATFSLARRMPVVLDESQADWMPERARKAEWDGVKRDGYLFVGHPDTSPVVKDLCRQVGFVVAGDKLTYQGTTIDLKSGSAVALIDLGDGKRCGLRLGKSRRDPSVGTAKVAITDDLGRFLRGKTEPRREEGLVFLLQ